MPRPLDTGSEFFHNPPPSLAQLVALNDCLETSPRTCLPNLSPHHNFLVLSHVFPQGFRYVSFGIQGLPSVVSPIARLFCLNLSSCPLLNRPPRFKAKLDRWLCELSDSFPRRLSLFLGLRCVVFFLAPFSPFTLWRLYHADLLF